MGEPHPLAINADGTYSAAEHERVMGFTQNVTLAELSTLDEAEIVRRHDLLLSVNYGVSMLEAADYRAEFNRRATQRLADAQDRYSRNIDRLVIALAIIAAVPLVLDLWDRWHLGDSVDYLWAAICAANGCS